jgi:hypothetical protein
MCVFYSCTNVDGFLQETKAAVEVVKDYEAVCEKHSETVPEARKYESEKGEERVRGREFHVSLLSFACV